MATPSDETTIKVGGVAISGWTDVKVTLRAEGCPNQFQLSFTENFPDQVQAVTVKPGDPCEVWLGADKVVTGYVDRYVPAIGPRSHPLTLVGRGKCQDLVDCSAEWPGCQIVGANALEIAQKLAKAYGISVKSVAPAGPRIPQFNLSLGETAWSIIERICRFAQLLAYEDVDGDLVLAQAGSDAHSSGFRQGENVLEASVSYAQDQRFSEYGVFTLATDVFSDAGDGGNQIGTAFDGNVLRNRKRYLVADAQGGRDVAKARAVWEASRRIGRGTAIRVTADSWRDSAGRLWTPNVLAPCDLPICKLAADKYVISEVSFLRGEQGSTAELMLMPKGAFLPEPVALQPQLLDQITPAPPAR